MTSTLAQARRHLEAATKAPDHVPSIIDPPCVVIEPADPYLTQHPTYAYNEYDVSMTAYVLIGSDDNDVMARDLDTRLLAAMADIDGTDEWSVTRVGKPGVYIATDWQAYGIALTVTARITT